MPLRYDFKNPISSYKLISRYFNQFVINIFCDEITTHQVVHIKTRNYYSLQFCNRYKNKLQKIKTHLTSFQIDIIFYKSAVIDYNTLTIY